MSRGRSRVQERVALLRDNTRTIVQTTAAASAAWVVAAHGLGYEQPLFAPVAAVISLGAAGDQAWRRSLQTVGGVVVGITVADLLASVIGRGAPQIALLVVLAMVAALLIGGGQLLVSEAAISAILIALQPAQGGLGPERLLEALVGGAVALAVRGLVFPADPLLGVERAAQRVFGDLGKALELTAEALGSGDLGRAEDALFQARGIDERLAEFDQALERGRDTARSSPPRRRALVRLDAAARVARQVDLAARNTRVLARAALRFVRAGNPAPAGLPEAVRELAMAVWALAAQFEEPGREEETRRHARRAAERATELLEDHNDLATSMIVGQVQSTAADLVRASGFEEPSQAPERPTEELLGRATPAQALPPDRGG